LPLPAGRRWPVPRGGVAAARRPPLAAAPQRADALGAGTPPGRRAPGALRRAPCRTATVPLPAWPCRLPPRPAPCLPLCRSVAAALDLRCRRALPPWTPAVALAAPQRLAAGLPPCLPALAAATADLGRAGGSSVPVGVREEDRRGLGHWGVGSCFGLSRLGLLG